MTRVVWLGGLVGIAAIALLIAFRGDAAASDGGSCTQVDGFVHFCMNVPTSGARRETSVPLIALPSVRADVRVEATVPGSDALAVAASVDRSVERVETLFGRTFSARPRVLLFGTSDSFARGASDLFGYSSQTAAYVSQTYGGIFDRGTLTIAVNWSSGGRDRMSAAVEHELTHLMIHELTQGRDLPVWLDEGIASLIEQGAPNSAIWSFDDDLTGRALAASGTIRLTQLASVGDFHNMYARVGRPLYAFCADAVRAIEDRIGWSGVLATLAAIGDGASFEATYFTSAGESPASLEARLDASTTSTIVVSPVDASGNVRYTIASSLPNSALHVSITGDRSYSVTFTATTDGLGLYRGSFGSTATPGTYTVLAARASATFSTTR